MSTSGKAKNASEAHELSVKLQELHDAVLDLFRRELSRAAHDNFAAECEKHMEFITAVKFLRGNALDNLECLRQADAEALRREHRKKEDEKKALRRLSKRKAYLWRKQCANMEELRRLGVLTVCIAIDLVKNNKGQEKMRIRTHSTPDDSRIRAIYANAEKELRRLEASGALEPLFEEMRRAKSSYLKSACEASSYLKSAGEAEAFSPVQNAANVVCAPAPEHAPGPELAMARARVHAIYANTQKELQRLEASGELEPVFEELELELMRTKNSFLKRACPPSEAPSRTTQQGNKRPKCTGEAEAASPVQNAATVVGAPAPEPAPAPARAPAAETTGAVAEVSDTGPPGPSDAAPASLLAEA